MVVDEVAADVIVDAVVRVAGLAVVTVAAAEDETVLTVARVAEAAVVREASVVEDDVVRLRDGGRTVDGRAWREAKRSGGRGRKPSTDES